MYTIHVEVELLTDTMLTEVTPDSPFAISTLDLQHNWSIFATKIRRNFRLDTQNSCRTRNT